MSTKRATKSKAATAGEKEVRGPVLDVLRELLVGRRDQEVIALVTALVSRNAELERLLGLMREARNRGERVSSAQLDLFLTELAKQQTAHQLSGVDEKLKEAADKNGGRPETTKPPKQPPVRRPAPPQLRRVLTPISVPAEQRACPVCGRERKCIGHEETELIDLIPAEAIVRLVRTEILACDPCDAELVRAPMADKVVAGGLYGACLVASLLIGKYWDGLPLNRQKQALERLGLSIASSSMSDQIRWAAELLEPIWRALMQAVLDARVAHVDGTGLPVRDRDGPGGMITGTLWGYVGDQDVAVYLYTSTGKRLAQRPGEMGPEQFLRRRTGFICADAANLFDSLFVDDTRIELGCNMHARRYFVKALEAGDLRASLPVSAFKALYDIEARVHDATPERRLEERQRFSRPVYDELLAWCRTYQVSEPPSSLLGKAIQYLLNHHVALTRFIDDGTLPIDNGIVERLHRRPAVGRRNYLFAGSHAGAQRAAIAYSVLATCHLVGVNPLEYLTDVLPRLARGIVISRDLPGLLPHAWKQARDAAAAAATPDSAPAA